MVDGISHDLEGWANGPICYLSEGDKVIEDRDARAMKVRQKFRHNKSRHY